VTAPYNDKVGDRLRSIRRQRGLSLQEVQRLSGGEFKAAVVGAYERGERSLSLPRLQRLSQFFQVPISHFLPQEEAAAARTMEPLPAGGVTIDLNRLERLSGTESVVFTRFLRSIQMMRQDFSGKVLTSAARSAAAGPAHRPIRRGLLGAAQRCRPDRRQLTGHTACGRRRADLQHRPIYLLPPMFPSLRGSL
jgi:transcriptional regulator with XRE-family HTH domain